MSGFGDVVTREAAWFSVDPPAGWSGTTPPALSKANGGPFDTVQGYWTKVPSRQRWLFVTCEGIKNDELDEFQAHREVLYNMLLTIYWSFEVGTGKLEDEQQNLHDAIDKVLIRLRGGITDHSHGGQFTAVAAGGPEGDGRISLRLPSAYEQVTARQSLVAEIRYTATDWLAGGS